jgi:hypothetical protein
MKELSAFKLIHLLKCCDIGLQITNFGLPRVNKSLALILIEDKNIGTTFYILRKRTVRNLPFLLVSSPLKFIKHRCYFFVIQYTTVVNIRFTCVRVCLCVNVRVHLYA